jgi:predicted alpha/beta-hydrolase family hydrolase
MDNKESNGYDIAIDLMMPILHEKRIEIKREQAKTLMTLFCNKLIDHALLGNRFNCGKRRMFYIHVLKRPGYNYVTKRKRGIRAIVDSEIGTELILVAGGELIGPRKEVVFEKQHLIKLHKLSMNNDYIRLAL